MESRPPLKPFFFLFVFLISATVQAGEPAMPSGSPAPAGPGAMTGNEKKKLSIEFKSASAREQKTLSRNERVAMKQFNANQSREKKSWNEQEKKARHQFFAEHPSGKERRAYIQDFLKRKEAFEEKQKNDYLTQKKSWREKQDYLKKLQQEREVQFNSQLEKGQRPDPSLWPKP